MSGNDAGSDELAPRREFERAATLTRNARERDLLVQRAQAASASASGSGT